MVVFSYNMKIGDIFILLCIKGTEQVGVVGEVTARIGK